MNRTVKSPAARYREIVSAARGLFQEKSYETATIRDIMTRVGVAKGTIYHYFDSKKDLLEAVIEQMVDEYVAGMQAVLGEAQGNALDRLRALIAAGDVRDEHAEELEYLHRAGNIGMHTRQLAVTISQLAPLYATVIRQGCDEGLFQTEHPLECAEFLLAGVQFLTDMGVYPWKQAELLRRAQALPALIEAQLQAPKGSFDFLLERF